MIRLAALALVGSLAAPHAGGAQQAPVATANGISVAAPHAIVVGPAAKTGAVYMAIANNGGEPDRLIAAEGDAARRIELHDHVLENGVARMIRLDQGVEIPPGATVELAQGGRHVMLMGLAAPLEDGDEVALELVFERAGRIAVVAPVERLAAAAHAH